MGDESCLDPLQLTGGEHHAIAVEGDDTIPSRGGSSKPTPSHSATCWVSMTVVAGCSFGRGLGVGERLNGGLARRKKGYLGTGLSAYSAMDFVSLPRVNWENPVWATVAAPFMPCRGCSSPQFAVVKNVPFFRLRYSFTTAITLAPTKPATQSGERTAGSGP